MTTTLTWPAGFPTPARDPFAYALPDLNQRTGFALGSRSRALYPDGPDSFDSLIVTLSAAQCSYIQGWGRFVLANWGDVYFNLNLYSAGAYFPREVKFTGPPSFVLVARNSYQMKFSVETRQGTTISFEYFEALEAFADVNDIGPAMQALENCANH